MYAAHIVPLSALTQFVLFASLCPFAVCRFQGSITSSSTEIQVMGARSCPMSALCSCFHVVWLFVFVCACCFVFLQCVCLYMHHCIFNLSVCFCGVIKCVAVLWFNVFFCCRVICVLAVFCFCARASVLTLLSSPSSPHFPRPLHQAILSSLSCSSHSPHYPGSPLLTHMD